MGAFTDCFSSNARHWRMSAFVLRRSSPPTESDGGAAWFSWAKFFARSPSLVWHATYKREKRAQSLFNDAIFIFCFKGTSLVVDWKGQAYSWKIPELLASYLGWAFHQQTPHTVLSQAFLHCALFLPLCFNLDERTRLLILPPSSSGRFGIALPDQPAWRKEKCFVPYENPP